MPSKSTLQADCLAAAAAMGKSNVWTVPGSSPGRFYLFNHHLSMCSQKCRITMREAGLSFTNVEVPLFNYSNYQPQYVRLRLDSYGGGPMVGEGFGSWNGSSSTSENGFDPCVVPLLVDLEAGKVVSDSLVICKYICETSGNLVPKDAEKMAMVLKHIEIVDKTPHLALLYDSSTSFDPRPSWNRHITAKGGLHKDQIKALDKWLSKEGQTWTDPLIKRAYMAKKQKTLNGLNATLSVHKGDGAYFEEAYRRTRAKLRELEADLQRYPGDWLCGDDISVADLFHGISLVRLIWLGYESWYGDLQAVKAYADRLDRRSSILNESILNPHSGPSKHLAPFWDKHNGWVSGFMYRRKCEMIGAITWSWTPTIAMTFFALVVAVVLEAKGVKLF